MSMRMHLLVLAVGLLVPFLILAAVLTYLYVTTERQSREMTAMSSARELAMSIDATISTVVVSLDGLAASEPVETPEVFSRMASVASQALGKPIAVFEGSRKVLDTSTPKVVSAISDDLAQFLAETSAGGQPATSNRMVDPGTGEDGVWTAVPIAGGQRVVAAWSSAASLSGVFRSLRLEPGFVGVALDRDGTILLRTVDQETLAGRAASSEWLTRATAPEGFWSGPNASGTDSLAAYTHSALTGWTAIVSVPRTVLDAPMLRTVWLVGSVGAIMLALGAAAAFWMASRISQAIYELAREGNALAHSLGSRHSVVGVREVREVQDALTSVAAEMRGRASLLQSILETVPSAMVVINAQGTLLSFSAAAERQFGYRSTEVVGRNVSILMPEPDKGKHDDYIRRYLETGERRIIGIGRVVTGLRKDGTRFPVELHVGRAEAGNEPIFTGFLRDLSDKQRIEQELRETQKMEAIGKLTGGVAHDFNNLLTVIKGNLEMIEARLDGRYHSLIKDAQEAADLAANLTSSLLAFGRRMPLNPQETDIGALVLKLGELFRRTLGETIEVVLNVSGSHRAVVDAAQLQNALLNLAINARDAMPGGGRLTISVERTELDVDYATANAEVTAGAYEVIEVRDTGIGMSPGVRERALEPFFTTKPAGSGTGLGLSSVYGFVKQSGGHLALYSEEGKGTSVRLYLPVPGRKDDARNTVAPAAQSDVPPSLGETILVVEDEERIRRVAVTRLSELGYRVIEAENGAAALAMLDGIESLDLVFTDVVMPGGIGGAELAEEVRRRRPEVRVLLTSGYAEPSVLERSAARNASWLRKPYSMGELARKLRLVLASPR